MARMHFAEIENQFPTAGIEMPPKSKSAGSDSESRPKRRRQVSKDTDEYVIRRERNNIAVKKSREKSRAKAKNTVEKVSKLKAENATLEQQVTILSKELGVLKDLFKMVHSGNDDDCTVNLSALEVKTEPTTSASTIGESSYNSESSQDTTEEQLTPPTKRKRKIAVRRVSNVNTDALQKDHEYFTTRR